MLRLEDASVRGVLDIDCEWLFRAAAPSSLTLDCGRWEVTVEAVGGGMGEGRSLWPLDEFSVDDCEVWTLPWVAASGRRKGEVVVPLPLSLFLRSPKGLLVILVGRCEDLPRCPSGSLEPSPRPGRRG
jgi:hypothetical protein